MSGLPVTDWGLAYPDPEHARLAVLKHLMQGRDPAMAAALSRVPPDTVQAIAAGLGWPDIVRVQREARGAVRDLEQALREVAARDGSPFQGLARRGRDDRAVARETAPRGPVQARFTMPAPHETLTQAVEAAERELGLADPVQTSPEEPCQPSRAAVAPTPSTTTTNTDAASTTTASSPDASPLTTTAPAAGPDPDRWARMLDRLDADGRGDQARTAIAELALSLAAQIDPVSVLARLDEDVFAGRPVDPEFRRLMAALLPAARYHAKRSTT